MAGWEQLTRDQLLVVVVEQAKVVEEQAAQIAVLTGQIAALTAQVAELTRLLGRNSGNSSLPPSSDRGNKPQRQPQKRGAAGRKPGKQPGARVPGWGWWPTRTRLSIMNRTAVRGVAPTWPVPPTPG